MGDEIFAHTACDRRWQTLGEHSINVAKLCKEFSYGKEDFLYKMGYLHDIGKAQKEFQNKLNGKNIKVDHSTSGAKLIYEKNKHSLLAQMLAYCIAGHHSGLTNGGVFSSLEDSTLYARLKKSLPQEIEKLENLEDICNLSECKFAPAGKNINEILSNIANKIRFFYSCLVDADYLDTESYCKNTARPHKNIELGELLNKLNIKLNSFSKDGEINIARSNFIVAMQKKMFDNSKILSLDLPTGSGKTLLSMKLALERAIKLGKDRIIYVIPYTSIIEQNAKVFKDIFGNDAVLEHHSNYEVEDGENEIVIRQCSENWDAKIIVTTNVQFFESFYSNKSSRLRKLHNIQNSVICFDEAHVIPLKLFNACMSAINYLANFENCDIILMSATMPNYQKTYTNLPQISNIIQDKQSYELFKRCKLIDLTSLSENDILEKIDFTKSNLIVVNTKNTARRIFDAVKMEEKVLLTTFLTPNDRRIIIEKIKQNLKQNIPVTVVSTSLVEAGVDFDFDFVYREINGVDSIIQCMGRCNREGKKTDCATYIFKSNDTEKLKNDTSIKIDITKTLLKKYEDISCATAVDEYFDILFKFEKEKLRAFDFSTNEYMNLLANVFLSVNFATIAERFHYIEEQTIDIVILNDEIEKILQNIMNEDGIAVRRKLAQNTVSVYKNIFNKMNNYNLITKVKDIFYLNNKEYYSYEEGLKIDIDSQENYMYV